MKTRPSIARTLVRNDRLQDYARSLQRAQDHGYKIEGVADFFRSEKNGRRLVLRHDVDIPAVGVRPMLEVESALNIGSTWYFRWCTFDEPLMRAIMDAGGEVGLHYETLADILMRKGITARAHITEAILQEARDELRREIDRFRTALRLSSLTIASHGHPRNQLVRMSNNVLATEAFCREAGVLVESYSAQLLSHFECYIADTNLLINRGWAYNQNLIEAIDAGHRTICFLSHPNHWQYTWRTRLVDLCKLVTGRARIEARAFRPTYDA